MLSAVRLAGSKVLVLGRSVRESSRINIRAERLIARAANIYVVRDHASCDIVGSRARFAPDFAFSRAVLHSSTLERRPFVGISLRHDRPVDIDALKTLVWEIDAEGHQAVLVTQVREDSSRHEMLAGELGLDHISWPVGRSHREHENVLNDCYATLTAVVSDRLHVLILGARQGAIPIIVDCENEQKLHASLDPVLLPQAIHLISTSSNPRLNLSLAERTRIASELNSASRLLEDLMSEVRVIIQ
jgi:polysaccharide pyruvyl transferase WcaK-like protein